MANDKKTSVIASVIVAVIAGAFAAAPGLYASYVNTPQQIKAELATVLLQSETQIKLQTNEIEAELNRVLQQSETQIRLQRDQEVATILARLDDPKGYVRTGAALSLGALGGEEIVPVLVGKLRESAMKLALLEMNEEEMVESDNIWIEKRFVTAVKQSLITIGLPALRPLVELNRDLRFADLRILGSRAGREAESEEEQQKLWEEISVDTCANDEVKDAIQSILIKVSSVKGSEVESTSIIANSVSLANIDLSYLALMRINLAEVDLTNADLRYARLTWTNFTNADLRNAILDDAIIYGANFEGADLTGARLNNISDFDLARVEKADFSSAIIDSDNLKDYLRQNGALNVPD